MQFKIVVSFARATNAMLYKTAKPMPPMIIKPDSTPQTCQRVPMPTKLLSVNEKPALQNALTE